LLLSTILFIIKAVVLLDIVIMYLYLLAENNQSKLNSLLRIICKGDTILLTDEASYLIITESRYLPKNTLALQDGVNARNIENKANIKLIDYPEFVKLSLAAEKVITW